MKLIFLTVRSVLSRNSLPSDGGSSRYWLLSALRFIQSPNNQQADRKERNEGMRKALHYTERLFGECAGSGPSSYALLLGRLLYFLVGQQQRHWCNIENLRILTYLSSFLYLIINYICIKHRTHKPPRIYAAPHIFFYIWN